MNQIISHSAVAVVCLSVGLIYQGFGDDAPAGSVEEAPPTKAAKNLIQPANEQKDRAQSAFAVEKPKVAATAAGPVKAEGLVEGGLAANIAEQYGATPGSAKELLAGKDSSMFETGEIELISEAFVAWFGESEYPGEEILDFITSDENSDEEKHVMEYLIASNTAMGTIDDLDLSIVKQLAIAKSEDSEHWENILNIVSIKSPEARTELLNTLPSITNENIVSASLLSIKPDFVSPTERSQILSNISTYTESDSDEVRSAAVMSLGQWSAQGYSYILEDMLANGTDDQKNAAIISANSGNIWSDEIESQTLSTLGDENVPSEIRNNAFQALSNQPLDANGYEQVHRYYTEHVQPLERLR